MPAVVAVIIEGIAVGMGAVEIIETALFVLLYNYGASLLIMGALYAYNRQQALKAARGGTQALENAAVTVKQAAAPRNVVYGRTRVGGVMVFAATLGATNQELYMVVVHAGHECDAIEEFYLDNNKLTLDGSGNCTSAVDLNGTSITKYVGYVTWKTHLGAAGQTVDSMLNAAFGSSWPSTSTLSGCCYSVLHLGYNQKSFSGGIPNVSVVLRGKKTYDPRTTTTYWNANSALAVRDFLTDNQIGFGCSSGEIDDTVCQSSANTCEDSMSLNGGGSEYRYTTNGIADTAAAPGSTLGDLCGAMAGSVSFVGGLFLIRAGIYVSPTEPAISETDLAGPVQIQTRDSIRDVCNSVKGVFVSAKSIYQPVDFPPVTNSTYVTQDGAYYWRDIQLPFTTSSATAQRLAKILLEIERLDITVNLRCKLTKLNLKVGDTVALNLPRYGWSGSQYFIINNSTLVADKDADGNPMLCIEFTLRLTASGIYSWSTSNETAVNPSVRSGLYNPFVNGPAAPTGVTATLGALASTINWSPNSEPDFDHYNVYFNTVNSFPGGTPLWSGKATQFIDTGRTVGTTYYYWVTAVNTAGTESSFSTVVSTVFGGLGGGGGTGQKTLTLNDSYSNPLYIPTGDGHDCRSGYLFDTGSLVNIHADQTNPGGTFINWTGSTVDMSQVQNSTAYDTYALMSRDLNLTSNR